MKQQAQKLRSMSDQRGSDAKAANASVGKEASLERSAQKESYLEPVKFAELDLHRIAQDKLQEMDRNHRNRNVTNLPSEERKNDLIYQDFVHQERLKAFKQERKKKFVDAQKSMDVSQQQLESKFRFGHSVGFIESWINTVLGQSDYVLQKEQFNPERAVPLGRFNCSKKNLIELGLRSDQIERIYRSLFVHSMGFIQTLRDIASYLEDDPDPEKRGKRDYLQINIWKVYQLLLEYCCATDYKMLLTKAQLDHDEQIRQKHDEIIVLQTGQTQKEKEIKDKMYELASEMRALEQQKIKFENSREEAHMAFLKQKAKAEKEIQLRLFFEQKVNMLFRDNANIQSKQRKLQEQIERLEETRKEQDSELGQLREEVLELRQYKASAEEKFKDFNLFDELEKVIKGQEIVQKQNAKEWVIKVKGELQKAQREGNRATDEAAALKRQVVDLKEQLAGKKEFITRLQALHDEATHTVQLQKYSVKQMEKEVLLIQNKNADLQQDNVSLQLRQKELQQEVADLKVEIEELKCQLADSNHQLSVAVDKHDGLQMQLQSWKEINRNLEEHLKYYVTFKEETQTKLESEMQMNMLLKAEKNGYYQFMKKLKVQALENDGRHTQDRQEQISVIESKSAQIQSQEDEIKDLEQSFIRLEKTLKAEKVRAVDLEALFAKYKEESERLNDVIQEQKVESTDQYILCDKLTLENREQKQRIEHLEALRKEESIVKEETISTLELRLVELPSLKEELKHVQETKEKEVAIYVEKLERVTIKLRVKEMQHEEMLTRYAVAFEKMKQVHAEDFKRVAAALAAKQELIHSNVEEVAALQEEVVNLNHGKVQMMLAIGALIKHNESKEHHLQKQQVVIDVAKMKLGMHLSEIQELEGKVREGDERLKEIEGLEAAAEQDKNTISQLLEENTYLERDVNRLRQAAAGQTCVPSYSHKAVWACPRTRNAREQTDKVHVAEASSPDSAEKPEEKVIELALETVQEEATLAEKEDKQGNSSKQSQASVGPPETPPEERVVRASAFPGKTQSDERSKSKGSQISQQRKAPKRGLSKQSFQPQPAGQKSSSSQLRKSGNSVFNVSESPSKVGVKSSVSRSSIAQTGLLPTNNVSSQENLTSNTIKRQGQAALQPRTQSQLEGRQQEASASKRKLISQRGDSADETKQRSTSALDTAAQQQHLAATKPLAPVVQQLQKVDRVSGAGEADEVPEQVSDEQTGSSKSGRHPEAASSTGFTPELFKHFEVSEESSEAGKVLLEKIQEYFRMLCEAKQTHHLARFFKALSEQEWFARVASALPRDRKKPFAIKKERGFPKIEAAEGEIQAQGCNYFEQLGVKYDKVEASVSNAHAEDTHKDGADRALQVRYIQQLAAVKMLKHQIKQGTIRRQSQSVDLDEAHRAALTQAGRTTGNFFKAQPAHDVYQLSKVIARPKKTQGLQLSSQARIRPARQQANRERAAMNITRNLFDCVHRSRSQQQSSLPNVKVVRLPSQPTQDPYDQPTNVYDSTYLSSPGLNEVALQEQSSLLTSHQGLLDSHL